MSKQTVLANQLLNQQAALKLELDDLRRKHAKSKDRERVYLEQQIGQKLAAIRKNRADSLKLSAWFERMEEYQRRDDSFRIR